MSIRFPAKLSRSRNSWQRSTDLAEQEKAEAVVMGVYGKGALNRRLFGSTTHHVIREARCLVLTLRG